MQDLIGYDEIIEDSMRSIICKTMKKIEKSGLPGKHYFVLTFLTNFPGVAISKNLKEKYPEEMTVVIQYQYKNLVINQDEFRISLSFSGKYEKLSVPYKSVTSFADPSMNFGLKFTVSYDDLERASEEKIDHANKNEVKGGKSGAVDLSAKIISLDAFRKNKNNNQT
jgi:hypothetical protein